MPHKQKTTNRKRVFRSFNEYKETYFPDEAHRLEMEDPVIFGKKLARKTAQQLKARKKKSQ